MQADPLASVRIFKRIFPPCPNRQNQIVIEVSGNNARTNSPRRFHMQYLLLLHAEEAGFARMTPEEQQQGMAAYMAYSEALTKAGAMMGSNRLQPVAAATTVRITDGKTQVLDGPFADSKEQLGGYFLIDVPDLDAALSWAARCPGARHGVVEVRPIWAM
jgi:hypothetical protein